MAMALSSYEYCERASYAMESQDLWRVEIKDNKIGRKTTDIIYGNEASKPKALISHLVGSLNCVITEFGHHTSDHRLKVIKYGIYRELISINMNEWVLTQN